MRSSIVIESQVDPEAVANGIKLMCAADAHAWVERLLAGLDTDAYAFAEQWIAKNPSGSVHACACGRVTKTWAAAAGMPKRCEYCGREVP